MIAYPNSSFSEVRPHGNFLARRHVRITVPGESRFKLLQLLAGEMCSLSALSLIFLVTLVVHRGLVGTNARGR